MQLHMNSKRLKVVNRWRMELYGSRRKSSLVDNDTKMGELKVLETA